MVNKKKVANVSVLLMAFLGVMLIYLMRRYINEDWGVYIPIENIYAIQFNIGFHWITLLGMVGTILLQLAIYAYVGCRRRNILKVIGGGIWILNAITYPIIVANSRKYLTIALRMKYEYEIGTTLHKIMVNMNYCIYTILILYIFIYLFTGLTVLDIQKNKTYLYVTRFIDIFFVIAGTILLVVRSFTNIWYIVLCVVTILVLCVLLVGLEKIWKTAKLDIDKMSLLSFVKAFFTVPADEYEFEPGDESSMLDFLISYYEQIEKEDCDDKAKKEAIYSMLKKLRYEYDEL